MVDAITRNWAPQERKTEGKGSRHVISLLVLRYCSKCPEGLILKYEKEKEKEKEALGCHLL